MQQFLIDLLNLRCPFDTTHEVSIERLKLVLRYKQQNKARVTCGIGVQMQMQSTLWTILLEKAET